MDILVKFVEKLLAIPSFVIELVGNRFIGNLETKEWYLYDKDPGRLKDGTRYEPSSFLRLWLISKRITLTKDDVLIDIGSGPGRAVFFFALCGIKKAIGLDLNKKLIEKARKNVKLFKGDHKKVEFWYGDALDFDLSSPNIFYFNNPFGEKTFRMVLEHIHNSLKKNPRKITVIYNHPICKDLLDQQKWLRYKGNIGMVNVHFWENV